MSEEQKIQELEVKVAFLEDTLAKLSDEYYQQQKDLENIKQQTRLLFEKLDLASSNNAQDADFIDEKPPHY